MKELLLDYPFDAVCLGPVRHFPAVQQTLQDRLGNGSLALAVLTEEAFLRGLGIHDA